MANVISNIDISLLELEKKGTQQQLLRKAGGDESGPVSKQFQNQSFSWVSSDNTFAIRVVK